MDFDLIVVIDAHKDELDLTDHSQTSIIATKNEMFERVTKTMRDDFGTEIINPQLLEDFGFNLEESYIGPIYESPFYFIFWFTSNRSVLLAIEHTYNENVEWILNLITYLINEGKPISFEMLTKMRYELLDFVTAPIFDEHSNRHLDLFYTFPQTFFLDSMITPSNLENVNIETLPETLSLKDEIKVVEFLLSQANRRNFALNWLPEIVERLSNILQMDNYFPENVLVVLNAIDALLQLPPSPLSIPPLLSFFEILESYDKLKEYQSLLDTIKIQKGFLIKEPPEVKEITIPFLPSSYSLIPYVVDVILGHSDPESAVNKWKKFRQTDEILRGYHFLLEFLGDYSYGEQKFIDSENFYAEALSSYLLKGSFSLYFHHLSQKLLQTRLQRILQYFTTSALHLDLHQFEKAISFGWSAIRLAITMLQQAISAKVEIQDAVAKLTENLPYAKRSLLCVESEMTPVIELKLDELIEDLTSFLSGKISLDEFSYKLEVNQEAFTYLMPQSPPRFLLLTPDGRLLYSVSADHDLTESDTASDSHLLAGVLTAIRTIFMEASISGSGNVKEIDAGDSTLYIEARDSLVLVVSAVMMTQELREFANSIADILQLEFGGLVREWDGSSNMIKDLIQFLRSQIKEKLL